MRIPIRIFCISNFGNNSDLEILMAICKLPNQKKRTVLFTENGSFLRCEFQLALFELAIWKSPHP